MSKRTDGQSRTRRPRHARTASMAAKGIVVSKPVDIREAFRALLEHASQNAALMKWAEAHPSHPAVRRFRSALAAIRQNSQAVPSCGKR